MIGPHDNALRMHSPGLHDSWQEGGVLSPKSFAGLALWLDATVGSSVTTASGNVSQWSDLSGNARHFTQATPGNRPPYLTSGGINGKASVQGTASPSQGLTCVASMATIMGIATAGELFIVGKLNADGASDPMGNSWGSPGQDSYFEFSDTKPYCDFCTPTRLTGNAISAGIMTAPFIYDVQSVTGDFRITINSTQNSSTNATTFTPGASVPALFAGGGTSTAGLIGEVVVYTRALAAAERTALRAYFKSKWGTP